MNLLLQEEVGEEELDKEMQSAMTTQESTCTKELVFM
jgi:hypothetical protein